MPPSHGRRLELSKKGMGKMTVKHIMKLIRLERVRQYELKMAGKFKQTLNEILDDHLKFVVLSEEIGEVAKELCEINHGNVSDYGNLKAELVQCAALIFAWLEGM
jgi:hypothetical protein